MFLKIQVSDAETSSAQASQKLHSSIAAKYTKKGGKS